MGIQTLWRREAGGSRRVTATFEAVPASTLTCKIRHHGCRFCYEAILRQTNLGPSSYLQTYAHIVNQVGGSAQVGLHGNSYLEGNLAYLKMRSRGDRPGGMVRFVQPMNSMSAFAAELGQSRTRVLDQIGAPAGTITLNGTGSNDPEGDALTERRERHRNQHGRCHHPIGGADQSAHYPVRGDSGDRPAGRSLLPFVDHGRRDRRFHQRHRRRRSER